MEHRYSRGVCFLLQCIWAVWILAVYSWIESGAFEWLLCFVVDHMHCNVLTKT
jgi:hypothetical protein